jgi:hypothetical protein
MTKGVDGAVALGNKVGEATIMGNCVDIIASLLPEDSPSGKLGDVLLSHPTNMLITTIHNTIHTSNNRLDALSALTRKRLIVAIISCLV